MADQWVVRALAVIASVFAIVLLLTFLPMIGTTTPPSALPSKESALKFASGVSEQQLVDGVGRACYSPESTVLSPMAAPYREDRAPHRVVIESVSSSYPDPGSTESMILVQGNQKPAVPPEWTPGTGDTISVDDVQLVVCIEPRIRGLSKGKIDCAYRPFRLISGGTPLSLGLVDGDFEVIVREAVTGLERGRFTVPAASRNFTCPDTMGFASNGSPQYSALIGPPDNAAFRASLAPYVAGRR